MQRYINQLIEDFKHAEINAPEEPDLGSLPYEEFEKAMFEIETAPNIPAKEKIGVGFEELPPAERMTIQQTQDLLEAMLNALNANGTDINFPGVGVPVKLAYTELRNQFKEGFHAMAGWHIDFCSGWCPDCAFVNYCDIRKENWTDEELEKE